MISHRSTTCATSSRDLILLAPGSSQQPKQSVFLQAHVLDSSSLLALLLRDGVPSDHDPEMPVMLDTTNQPVDYSHTECHYDHDLCSFSSRADHS